MKKTSAPLRATAEPNGGPSSEPRTRGSSTRSCATTRQPTSKVATIWVKCNLPARRRDPARILSGNLTMEPTSRREMEATVAKSDSKDNLRNDHFIAHVLLPRWHPRTLLHRNGSEASGQKGSKAVGTANLLDVSAKISILAQRASSRGRITHP
jgi:hypothetical protein